MLTQLIAIGHIKSVIVATVAGPGCYTADAPQQEAMLNLSVSLVANVSPFSYSVPVESLRSGLVAPFWVLSERS